VVTRARSPHATGRVSFRGLDLGSVIRAASPHDPGTDGEANSGAVPIEGQLSGELIADDVSLLEPSKSRARLIMGPTQVSRGGQTLTLKPPATPIVLDADALTIPPLEVTLETKDGFRGGFVLTGEPRGSAPTRARARGGARPIDMAVLPSIVPDVERASGRVQEACALPDILDRRLSLASFNAAADDIEIRGLPSTITDLHIDARASSDEVTASALGKSRAARSRSKALCPCMGSRWAPRLAHHGPVGAPDAGRRRQRHIRR